MKLIYYPMLFSLNENRFRGENHGNFWCRELVDMILTFFPPHIPFFKAPMTESYSFIDHRVKRTV